MVHQFIAYAGCREGVQRCRRCSLLPAPLCVWHPSSIFPGSLEEPDQPAVPLPAMRHWSSHMQTGHLEPSSVVNVVQTCHKAKQYWTLQSAFFPSSPRFCPEWNLRFNPVDWGTWFWILLLHLWKMWFGQIEITGLKRGWIYTYTGSQTTQSLLTWKI